MKKSVYTSAGRMDLNTATAEIIGSGISGSGEEKVVETLYLSTQGIYFLCGTGGKNTRWGGRRDIKEISGRSLLFWCYKHEIKKVIQFYNQSKRRYDGKKT